MVGRCFKISAVSASLAAALWSTSTFAADYSPPAPPVFIPPPVVEYASSWYLRGDIGITNQQIDNLTNVQDVNNSVQNVGLGFDSSGLFGIGIGYNWNDWLRFDLTGEYRSRANFHGSQTITSAGNTYTDEYSGSKSEWLFLANAYVDLGTWSGFTPFIGAGIGGARVTIHGFQDVCTVCTPAASVAFGDDHSQWNFAWALHAGLAYKVTKNVTFELAYRYVNLGDAESGDLYTYNGINNINNPMKFENLTSHDVKVGLRFNLDDSFDFWSRPQRSYLAPAPVYTQPAPVYTPPPVYSQPAPVYQPPVYQPPVYQPPVYQPPISSRG